MPRLYHPIDYQSERYIDPHYCPSLEVDKIRRREVRSRSCLWRWFYWFLETILYFNIHTSPPPPPSPPNKAERKERLQRLIGEEGRKQEALLTKQAAYETKLENWRRLNDDALEQNDLLQTEILPREARIAQLHDLIRFHSFDGYRHEVRLTRENAELRQRLAPPPPSSPPLLTLEINANMVDTDTDTDPSDIESECMLVLKPESPRGNTSKSLRD
jgi:hypothetical protein